MGTTRRKTAVGAAPPGGCGDAPGRRRLDGAYARPALALFLCLLAAQSGITALSPVLPRVAEEFEVSVAAAGQLRTGAGVVAGATALLVGLLARRFGLRRVLGVGLGLLAVGCLASGGAPTLAVLAAGQIATGAAVAILLAAGTAAAAEWAPPERRARLLSLALIGQACAWIVGMPLVGITAELSWRYSIAVPLAATVAAGLALGRAPATRGGAHEQGGIRSALRNRALAAWAAGELLACSAWAGTLVYAGAFFIEVRGSSLARTGLILGAGAVAYLPGSSLARRVADGHARGVVVGAGLAAAATVAVFTSVQTALWPSAVLFALLCFLGGARTLAGSTLGLAAAPRQKLAVMGLRAAATHFGYLLGGALGGLALTLGGYEAIGWTLALLFVAALAPHVVASFVQRARPAACAAR